MAALGLHRGVAVAWGGESRPHADDHGRHVDARAQVSLGEDGVDEHGGTQLGHACRLGVDEHGDVAGDDDGARLGHVVREARAHALNLAGAQPDGLGEAHGAADGRGHGQVAHDNLAARAVQAKGDAGGDVSGAANLYEHGTPFRPAHAAGRRMHNGQGRIARNARRNHEQTRL